jgi:spore germination protein
MKRISLFVPLFLSLLILCSCSEKHILDEVGLVQAIGYDLTEDEKIEGIFIVPRYLPNHETVVQKFVEVSDTSKGIRRKVSSMTESPLVAGQLRVALYSEELAKKGIITIIDTLYRDPSIGNRMNLAIVRGDIKEMLLSDYSNRESVASYLQNLIQHNIEKETLSTQNLHLFLYRHYSDGQDAFMPIIQKEKNHIKVIDIGIFRDDKLAVSIPLKEGFMFKLLLEGYKSGKYELKLKSEEEEEKDTFAVIENLSSSSTYYLYKKKTGVKFKIKLKMKGQINEYSGKLNMEKNKTLKYIEKELEKEIRKESMALIKKFQKEKVDPIGFGNKYRSKTYNWNSKKFYEKIYPNMEVDVEVDVKIIETGVVE